MQGIAVSMRPSKYLNENLDHECSKKILWSSLFVVLVFFFAYLLFFLSPVGPLQSRTRVQSSGRITYPDSLPYIVIQISPPGYPVAGNAWKINVYEVREFSSSGVPILIPASDSIVNVNLISSGKESIYQLKTDANGETSFIYRPEFTDIAFQARRENNTRCDPVVLTIHYADAQSLDIPLYTSTALMVVEIAGVVVGERKKKQSNTSRRKMVFERVVFGLDLGLFSFVALVSGISRVTQKTIWGFPENILDGYITITFLQYVWLAGLALSICLLFYVLVLLYQK